MLNNIISLSDNVKYYVLFVDLMRNQVIIIYNNMNAR